MDKVTSEDESDCDFSFGLFNEEQDDNDLSTWAGVGGSLLDIPNICHVCSTTNTPFGTCIKCEQNVDYEETLRKDKEKENQFLRHAHLNHFTCISGQPLWYRHSIGSLSLHFSSNIDFPKAGDANNEVQYKFGDNEVDWFFNMSLL